MRMLDICVSGGCGEGPVSSQISEPETCKPYPEGREAKVYYKAWLKVKERSGTANGILNTTYHCKLPPASQVNLGVT